MNGKNIKPKFFNGYLYIRNSIEGIGDEIYYFVFEKGDWMKDKRIPKPKEIEHKDVKQGTLTREGLLEALDKVILTVKKPKSPAKGKTKTSE